MAKFRVKVCGVTTVEDAVMARDAGADALGLNFHPPSPRCLATGRALEIADAVRDQVVLVGLFVNAEVDQIVAAHKELGLDLVQLHGDEPPEFLAELCDAGLEDVPIMRAFRCESEGISPVEAYLARCRDLECPPDFVLIDAHQVGAYGGTGVPVDWATAARYHGIADAPPLVLAGGLTPQNITEAIAQSQPMAVDTASGVESAPGVKDEQLVRQFVAKAKEAFAKVD